MSLNNEVTYSIDTNQVIISTPGPQGPSGLVQASVAYSASAGTATYAASAGLVVSASGIPTRWFGSFYDSGSQVAGNTGSAYAMTFQYTDYANGISASSSSIIFAHAGVYNVQWSGQFENTDSNDHDACIWMKKNGVDVVGSTGLVSIPAKHGTIPGHTINGWNYIMPVNAGDWLQLYWQVDSTAVTIQYYPGQINPTRPDTSSILLTAVQV